MVYKCFSKKSSGSGIAMNQIINWQMNFINKLLKNLRKVYSSFRENIWGIDLADMESLSKNNRGIKY